MPLLLYPLLGFAFRLVAIQQASDSNIEYRLAFDSEEQAKWLSEVLPIGHRALDTSGKSDVEPDLNRLYPGTIHHSVLKQLSANPPPILGSESSWAIQISMATGPQGCNSSRMQLLPGAATRLTMLRDGWQQPTWSGSRTGPRTADKSFQFRYSRLAHYSSHRTPGLPF